VELLRNQVHVEESGVPKEWRLVITNDNGSKLEFITKLQGIIWIKELPPVLL
jgi:bifunctional DNA-binding transcriptional regulator/antitoxin component of YhaV-PrlF toxin-antitoxin module